VNKGRKLEVVKWWQGNDYRSCHTLWIGKDENQALIVACFYLGKAIIEAQCSKGSINPRGEELDMSFVDKVACRITIQECINSRREASGEKPKIVKSFGDETIEIFQRPRWDR